MKIAAVALLAAVAANAQFSGNGSFNDCHNTCADRVSKNTTAVPNCAGVAQWKDNACLCNGTYQTLVKNCLYQSGCNIDVPKWFDEAKKICGPVEMPPRGSGGGGRPGSSASSSAAAQGSAAAAASAPKSNAARNGVVAATIVIPAVVGGLLLL